MRPSFKELTAVAGITCAIAGAGPVALAGAATPPTTPASGTPLLPGLSCGVNQGLLPGIPNLGPTGPLGPLGSSGPGGGSGSNLPCGLSAINLGPTGPLGPGGTLGGGQQPPATQPSAPTSAPTPAPAAAPQTGHGKRTPKKPARHKRAAKHRHVTHNRPRAHSKRGGQGHPQSKRGPSHHKARHVTHR
jgi:hypothetical protein